MSSQAFALLGVAVGALLAGGADLLLAWRKETIEARAGVHIIRSILEEAKGEVARLNAQEEPRWGYGRLPDSQTWDVYRSAVSARLPLATLQQVDKAMRQLDALNTAAARAFERADQLEGHIWSAAMSGEGASAAKLTQQPSPEILTSWAKAALSSASNDFAAAHDQLIKVAPVRPPGKGRGISALRPWGRWHWRSLVAGLLAMTIAAAVITATVTPTSEATEVQDALSAHLNNPALTACEPVKDHEDRFSCVVVEEAEGSACQTGTAFAAPRHLLTSSRATLVGADSSCDAIDRALEYSAARQRDTDCIAFLETAVAEVPSRSEQSKPGFIARLKAKLNKGAAPEADVPPVIVPDTAFIDGC